MNAQEFQDAMVAAFGQVNLSQQIGTQFKDSLKQIGIPQVPPLVLGSTKLETTENLYDHRVLLDLEFTRLGITNADTKANFLKTTLGKDHITTVQNLTIPPGGEDDAYVKQFKVIQKRFGLENPEPQARAKFMFQINHQAGDDAITMAERLRRTGNLCNYGGDLDKNILQILLSKCLDKKWRMHVRTQKYELPAALEYASQLREDRDADRVVERQHASGGRVNFTRKFRNGKKGSKWQNRSQSSPRSNQCTHCGKPSHGKSEKCPAEGTKCSKCGLNNHWAMVCRTKRTFKKGGNNSSNSKHFSNKKRYNNYAKKVEEEKDTKDTKDESPSEKDSFVRHVKLNNQL